MRFFSEIEKKILYKYSENDLFQYKKSISLFRIILVIAGLFGLAGIPAHSIEFESNPYLMFGDIILLVGLMLSMYFLIRGRDIIAGNLFTISFVAAVFIHNVVGDFYFGNSNPTLRIVETLVVVLLIYIIVSIFASKTSQIIIHMIATSILFLSHYFVLTLYWHYEIPKSYNVYLIGPLIVGLIGLIGLRLTNEAIEVLVNRKNELQDWNDNLEGVVKLRTNELEESNQQLELLATIDPLTGLRNRRNFNLELENIWNSAKRHGDSLAIVMIDIDHFKRFNDLYGHQKGDDCLATIGQVFKSYMRRTDDFVARYGGEEFIVILTRTSKDKIIAHINELMDNIRNLKIPHEKNGGRKIVTVSIGIAFKNSDEKEPLRCIRNADEALYKAKESGRDCIVLFN